MFHNPKYPCFPAHATHMRELLGFRPTAKLPSEGMTPRLVQGHVVWVEPLKPKPEGMRKGNKVHRIMCRCPGCAAVVPAGRLYQHKCKNPLDWRQAARENVERAQQTTEFILSAKEREDVLEQTLNHTLRLLPVAEAWESIKRLPPSPGTNASLALSLFKAGLPQP